MNPFFRCALVGLVTLSASEAFAEPFELKDGDKVVWLGSTLIEREQRYGYWETALTARWPDRNITFRNLGWSGDNVYGEARLAFDITNPALGLKRMVDLTLAEKPTVIFICYGMNESFEGEVGLPKFEKGLEKLLDELKPAKARIVLMTPIPIEKSGSEATDVNERNTHLATYRDVISKVARRRGTDFRDLFKIMGEGRRESGWPTTDNGIHLNELGYGIAASDLSRAFEWKNRTDRLLGALSLGGIVIVGSNGAIEALGVKTAAIKGDRFAFELTAMELPDPLLKTGSTGDRPRELALRVQGLHAGKHTLRIDGKATRITESAEQWADKISTDLRHDYDQVEQLRQAIIEKNQLYFYRWRPQNETYLFGFRKHEQGKNAKEVAEYDPLIAAKEKEIAKLRVPKTHRYEIVPVEKK